MRIEIEDLFDADGAIDRSSYDNPCGHADNGNNDGVAVCEQAAHCTEGADTAVAFNLVVVRHAEQGFFDVAVNFADVFCSAKVDCKDALLLNSATSGRRPTVVVAFACTSGAGEPTWLHMSDVAVVCGGGYTWLDPHLGPGQQGPQSDAVWEFATYRGKEGFAALDKCFWNLAIGLDVGATGTARDCRLLAQATASPAAFDGDRHTPAHTIYPYVAFDVPLTDGNAAFTCGQQALNAPGSGVSTGYTELGGLDFPWQWRCGDDTPITEGRLLCAGQTGADTGTFSDTPAGVVFAHGALKSPLYQLPQGLHLDGCCGNPCPGCQP